jgi:tetratricopeptide (TPR) repeat protein
VFGRSEKMGHKRDAQAKEMPRFLPLAHLACQIRCRKSSVQVDSRDKVTFPPRRSVLEIVRPTRRAVLPQFFACVAMALTLEQAAAQTNSSSSWWPLGHSTSAPAQSADAADDPIALKTPAKAGVELYIAVANLYVQSGKYAEAEDQYQIALKKAPSDVRVLLGYAILKDQINQPQEAMKLYDRAKEKHPKDPSVYNNLAVHYARWEMNREAIEAARRAVELRPRECRYRNNLAALLVESGSPREAYKQLREVYDEPVAHYNLGFLLNKRGQKAAALQEFTIALELNPRMALAREWVERISRERSEGGPGVAAMGPMPTPTPQQMAPNPTPSYPRAELPLPPPSPMPQQYSQQNPLQPPAQAPYQPQYPPQYPPQNPAPAQPQFVTMPAPVQMQSLPADPGPAAIPAPPQFQYPAGPQNPPPAIAQQSLAPRDAGLPQFQYPVQNSAMPPQPAAGNPPLMANRDGQFNIQRLPPPVDGGPMNRLPPVTVPPSADGIANQPGPDVIAPDPPGWRR